MGKILAIAIGLAVIGLIGVGLARVWNRPIPPALTGSGAPQQVPELTFPDYDGREVKLSDFRGKTLVVNTWASWCPFCVDELPDFASAQEEFGDRVVVIAVNRQESLDVARRFSDKVGVIGRLTLLLDPSDSFYRTIGGFSMPETIFVDREGQIRIHKRGPMSAQEIREKIQSIL